MENHKTDAPPPQMWAEFLFSRVLVYLICRENYGDMHGYFDSVSRWAAKGNPYGGPDPFGYPALAFLFVSIPWLFGARKFDLYYPFYRGQCFLFDVLLFHLLSRRCSREGLLVYIVCTTLLANLLYSRLDVILGCLLFLALALEARDSLNLASLTLGVSIALKIIPVLLVPCWLAWTLPRSLMRALAFLCFLALGAGVPFGIAYCFWGKSALFFMGAHAERGIQLESIWSSIQLVLMEFGFPGKVYFHAGSYNLSTPMEAVFRVASHIAGGAAALWGAVVAMRLGGRGGHFILAVTSTLGALILASKVFSPQYLLFFLPLLAWSLESMDRPFRHIVIALTLTCCVLTTWVYPYHEKQLVAISRVATMPLIARNVVFAVLVVFLQVHAWRWSGRKRRPVGVPLGMEATGAR